MAVDRKAVADALARANARTGLFCIGPIPVKTERGPGWYWVRWRGRAPEVGFWANKVWWFVATEMYSGPEDVIVVSGPFTPPAPGAVAPEPAPRVRVRWGVPVGDGGVS